MERITMRVPALLAGNLIGQERPAPMLSIGLVGGKEEKDEERGRRGGRRGRRRGEEERRTGRGAPSVQSENTAPQGGSDSNK
ncbi:unnamed protein product [Prorocentrum cordatum]|uniref:Uncharacterized protein n=1 Tax=Prorocentrum cordatum TaxID=2364126 RepID=A0ABN9V4Y4_9DINO|nr:unnamed protein product [Polarella glacialis]